MHRAFIIFAVIFALVASEACETSHCMNGGECVVRNEKEYCNCPDDWEGRFCTDRVCGENARYVFEADECQCAYPFTGDTCSTCKPAGPSMKWVCIIVDDGSGVEQQFVPIEMHKAFVQYVKDGHVGNTTAFEVGEVFNGTHYDCACRPLPSEGAKRSALAIARQPHVNEAKAREMHGRFSPTRATMDNITKLFAALIGGAVTFILIGILFAVMLAFARAFSVKEYV